MEIKKRKSKRKRPKIKVGRPVTLADIQAVKDRRIEALELRSRGWSYLDIGSELGVSEVSAFKYVKQELNRIDDKLKEKTERLRTLEITRLDKLLVKLELPLKSKDYYERYGAVDRVLKIMDRRAKYLPGMDAPVSGKLGLEEGMEGLLKSAGSEVVLMLKRLAGEEEAE